MSRKQRRRQQRAAQQQKQQEAVQQQPTKLSRVITSFVETEYENTGFPFIKDEKQEQLFFESSSVVERHITIKRVPL